MFSVEWKTKAAETAVIFVSSTFRLLTLAILLARIQNLLRPHFVTPALARLLPMQVYHTFMTYLSCIFLESLAPLLDVHLKF